MISYIGYGLNAPGVQHVGVSFFPAGPGVQEATGGGGGGGDDDTEVMVVREGMIDPSWFHLVNGNAR